jgi:hypothetical protein
VSFKTKSNLYPPERNASKVLDIKSTQLLIKPKNHKIIKYLFKHNNNSSENIFQTIRARFKRSNSIFISTPYIKNTKLLDGNILDNIEKFLEFDHGELSRKAIYLVYSNTSFETYIKRNNSRRLSINKN